MASTYLTRTNASAPTLGTKFTFSTWVKVAVDATFIDILNQPEQTHVFCMIEIKPQLDIQIKNGSGTTYVRRRTNRDLRDVNGWYHLVMTYDSTLAAAEDRLKIFVNGERQSSWTDQTGTIDQDMVIPITANTEDVRVGCNGAASGAFMNGCMSHYYFIDGLAYEASTFGSTDATTGEWKITTNPTIAAYGNNGFLILKDGNTITDQSGGSNNLTLGGGTLTKTEDNPSNVFATINPLDNFYNGLTLTNGNTSWVSTSPYSVTRSTLGASSGKYYFEMKVVNEGNTDYEFGIVGAAGTSTSSWMGSSGSYGYAYESNAKLRANGTTVDPWGSTYDDGDILGCAFDLDNNKIYFSKNGSWQESGNPSSGSNGYTITAAADTPAGAYFVGAGDFSGSPGQSGHFNFGNGYFGTSAISSAGTNASNNGLFEYDVPTGYTALSTKGLNE